MAKRLTDSCKWEDPWFMDLSNENRILWLYILDKCDHAGIWRVNKPLAEFILRFKGVDWDDFLEVCLGRIIQVSSEKWFIPKFIFFQYGVLSEDCRPHRPVIEILEKLNLKGYLYPINRVKEMDKEKEKDKETGGSLKGGRFSPPSLDEVKALFLEKGYPGEAEKFMAYFETVGWVVGRTHKPMKNWRGAVATWVGNLRSNGVMPKQAGVSEAQSLKEIKKHSAPPPKEWDELVKKAVPKVSR